MNVKKLKELIAGEDDDREVVLHLWDGSESVFVALDPSANLHANTENLFVLVDGHRTVPVDREILEIAAQHEAAIADLRFGEANRLKKILGMKRGTYVPNPCPHMYMKRNGGS